MFRLILVVAVVAFWIVVIQDANRERDKLHSYQACMAEADTTLDQCLRYTE